MTKSQKTESANIHRQLRPVLHDVLKPQKKNTIKIKKRDNLNSLQKATEFFMGGLRIPILLKLSKKRGDSAAVFYLGQPKLYGIKNESKIITRRKPKRRAKANSSSEKQNSELIQNESLSQISNIEIKDLARSEPKRMKTRDSPNLRQQLPVNRYFLRSQVKNRKGPSDEGLFSQNSESCGLKTLLDGPIRAGSAGPNINEPSTSMSTPSSTLSESSTSTSLLTYADNTNSDDTVSELQSVPKEVVRQRKQQSKRAAGNKKDGRKKKRKSVECGNSSKTTSVKLVEYHNIPIEEYNYQTKNSDYDGSAPLEVGEKDMAEDNLSGESSRASDESNCAEDELMDCANDIPIQQSFVHGEEIKDNLSSFRTSEESSEIEFNYPGTTESSSPCSLQIAPDVCLERNTNSDESNSSATLHVEVNKNTLTTDNSEESIDSASTSPDISELGGTIEFELPISTTETLETGDSSKSQIMTQINDTSLNDLANFGPFDEDQLDNVLTDLANIPDSYQSNTPDSLGEADFSVIEEVIDCLKGNIQDTPVSFPDQYLEKDYAEFEHNDCESPCSIRGDILCECVPQEEPLDLSPSKRLREKDSPPVGVSVLSIPLDKHFSEHCIEVLKSFFLSDHNPSAILSE